MSRAITIAALSCVLLVGAAATSILARDSVPAASAAMISEPAVVANRAAKSARLDRPAVQLASAEPAEVAPAAPVAAEPVEIAAPLRQAYASASPADIPLPKVIQPEAPAVTAAPAPAPKPKAAAKPPAPKPYALLSDAQIAGIRGRLKLSQSQEYYWPAVESALRNVARRMQANRLSNPHAATPVDTNWQEVQELKSAAMPLLFQLRDDQKEEVRKLARLIGLEQVAQQI